MTGSIQPRVDKPARKPFTPVRLAETAIGPCATARAALARTAESAIGMQSSLVPYPALPSIGILLCTYHGQHYLAEQLESIAAQTYPNWKLWVSDDGSQDDTHAVLERYREKWGAERISILRGPGKGFVANFLALVCDAGVKADFYAFADQDDIWEADKLQRAVGRLRVIPKAQPSLYCSRTRLVDAGNRDIGFSPLFRKPPGFANALVQNIGGGNTMVFNHAARLLLCEAGADVSVVTHDWWTYLVVSGCGGAVIYDSYPSLRYRQHNGNLIGMNSSWMARLMRYRLLFKGQFRRWNDENIRALHRLAPRLTPQNRAVLSQFMRARNRWLVPRLVGMKRAGVYRQTVLGNIGLFAGALARKI